MVFISIAICSVRQIFKAKNNEDVPFKLTLRYATRDTRDTRHARIFIFMRDTRIKKIMIRDTRHATREFVFFMRDIH
jgi:hypothetical protein